MIQWYIDRQIAASEARLGVPLDYMRYVAAHSLSAVWRLARFVKVAEPAPNLPAAAASVAGIVSAQADDCGSCVQIGVNLARQQGVSRDILNAVVRRQPDELPDDLRDVYHFAAAVTSGVDDEALRERLRERYGDRGLIDLALAIAMHRVYPTFKQALGYAKSCSLVSVET
ncbi:MAG: carboxymuconolactone decarboxylase family protein [Pirellulales bacterium]